MHHVMHLLPSQFFLECNVVQLFQTIAPGPLLGLASLSREAVQPLRIDGPAVGRPGMIELIDKGAAASPPAASAYVGLFLEIYQPLLYRAGTPRLGSVRSSSLKKRRASLSMMTAGRRSKNLKGISFDEGTRAAAKSVAKA